MRAEEHLDLRHGRSARHNIEDMLGPGGQIIAVQIVMIGQIPAGQPAVLIAQLALRPQIQRRSGQRGRAQQQEQQKGQEQPAILYHCFVASGM